MKKILLVLLITILTLAGCANQASTALGETNDAQTEDTQKDTEDGSDVEDEMDENGDIDGDDTTQDEQGEEDSSDAGLTEESEEPDYEAILSEIAALLPQGASLGEKLPQAGIMGGQQTAIQRDGYVCENEYQELLSYNEFLVTAGCVCFASTDLDPTAYGDTWIPVLMMRACEDTYNSEQIGDAHIFEAQMLLFCSATIGENEIPEEERYAYFWCICKANVEFDDPEEDVHYSTWIFLNQECFTKEEVKAIAEGLQ